MKFKIYQVNMTNEDVNLVNTSGSWATASGKSDRVKAHFLGALENKFKESFAVGVHTHVANIEADNLEDAFRIGNIGPEENIERLSNRIHSLSVGDVVESPDGVFHVVASMGFEILQREVRDGEW